MEKFNFPKPKAVMTYKGENGRVGKKAKKMEQAKRKVENKEAMQWQQQ